MTADDKVYMAEVLEWALRYAERGFYVFPCHSVNADGSCTCNDPTCEDIGKHPRTTKGFKDASKDKARVEKWFGPKAKLSNVAIRTGKISEIASLILTMGRTR
jgi:putative DNA primase/helicase